MVRSWLLCTTVALVTLAAGCSARSTSASAAATPSAVRGRPIFAANCAACHGVRGQGSVLGPSLRAHRRTFASILRIVTDPESPMPKLYPGTLTAEQVRDVSAYVESL
ncbi:MAG: c-type cytochrome [Vulcanimicrobiaceae bacterium]